ncbi:MAG TPA: hypothetical protein VGN07_01485 [Steroidobacteraceae bacterium]|jgi:hypothetical protein
MKRPSLAKLQKQCDDWNAKWPVGSLVTCTKDSGDTVTTVTTSEAQVLSGHSAVIWMKDIRGCYLLDRVKCLAA